MEAYFGEFVFQHLKEHGKKMGDCPATIVRLNRNQMELAGRSLFFAKDGCQPADLGAQRRSYMLGLIGDKVFNAGHNFIQ